MSDNPRSAQSVLLDGKPVPVDDARLRAVSGSVLYGRGVFTTIAFVDGEPFEWLRHVERLNRDAGAIGLESVSGLAESLLPGLVELADRNGHRNGKARITFLEASPPLIWDPDTKAVVSTVVQSGDLPPSRDSFFLTVSPFPLNSRSPLAGIKSCNYLEPILAADEARRRGFDEAIRLNEQGKVAGCCLANLFWVSRKGGAIRTPSKSTGCLPGTTRGYLLDSIDAEEVEMTLQEFLEDAAAVFVTSAVKGIRSVGIVEGGSKLAEAPGDILRLFPR